MQQKLLQQLKEGKKLRIKHPEYQFTMNVNLVMEDNDVEPSVYDIKISLPQKANKGEKLLLKYVQIYCYDILCNNLLKDVKESKEYQKLLEKLK